MSRSMSGHDRRAWLVVLLTGLCVLLAGIAAPKNNWDMVAYVAAAHEADGSSGRELRDRTYADVRAQVDPASYRDLTTGAYRGTVARDPVSLGQQLPFYTPRLAYIAGVRLLGGLTGSYTQAAQWLAAIFALLSVVAMGAVMMRAGVSPLLLPLLVSPLGIVSLARLATPDSMACFASLLLVATLLRPSLWSYLLIAVLPAIRSDYVIFSALAAMILFLVDDRRRAAIALVAAVAVYLVLGRISGNYGYLNLLNFTLFGQIPYPAGMAISTDPQAYAAAIATGVNYMVSDGIFLIYAIGLALLWHRRAQLTAGDRYPMVLLALPLAFATAHFALFPSYDKRFLVSSFFLVTVGILRAVTRADRPIEATRAG